MTSPENVRFLTGVQRMMTPIWAMLKSGLQVVDQAVTAPIAAPMPAQMRALAVAVVAAAGRTHRKARRSSRDPSCGCNAPRIPQVCQLVCDACTTGCEDAVSDASKTHALVGTTEAGAAEHRRSSARTKLWKLRSETCTVGVDGLHVDRVARTSRDVLDRNASLHGPAPLVVGMTRGLGWHRSRPRGCYAPLPTTGTDPKPDRPSN